MFGDRTGALVGVEFVGDDFDILTCAALTTVQVARGYISTTPSFLSYVARSLPVARLAAMSCLSLSYLSFFCSCGRRKAT